MKARSKKTVNKVYLALAAIAALAAVLLCALAPRLGVVISRPDGDPAVTVKEFFGLLFDGHTDKAYSLLADSSGLGLENLPEDEVNAEVYSALLDSFSYSLAGECVTDGLSARQDIAVTYLDLALLREAIKGETAAVLTQMTEAADSKDEYRDEHSSYRPEFIDAVYKESVRRALDRLPEYYTEALLSIELTYEGGKWMILLNDELLTALRGGIG